ncbi:helix-turn-helix transcriptional regulator [Mycobacterium sp. pW049]|uniref:helix-turn-helix transcriptional regulator n=1 Tax=[Mycobacterium] bulgaricum TaxID=3238985 RepID=UPI00351B51C9
MDLINIKETAQLVSRPEATVRWWIATGTELGPLSAKIGRRRMFRRADVEAWINAQFGA